MATSDESSNEKTDKFSFLNIDIGELDQEWVKQSRLYHKWATKLADARFDHDTAKSKLDAVEAECDRDIRLMPSDYGIQKITEERVKKAVILHPDYAAADQDLNHAKHRMHSLEAVVYALDHKKRALEKLVDLRLADYFSDPRAPEAAREQLEAERKRNIRNRRSKDAG